MTVDFWFWAAEHMSGWDLLLPILLATAITALLISQLAPALRERRRQAHVRATGEAARATVLSVSEVPSTPDNNKVVLRLRLRVHPASGQAFDTSLETRVSPLRLTDFLEGKDVRVRFDAVTRGLALDQRTE